MEKEKINLIEEVAKSGTDIDEEMVKFLMQEAFLGYKYRKNNHKLYTTDAQIPIKLISTYYSLKDRDFDNMKRSFITHYIKNESALEGIDNNAFHGKQEVLGLEKMYDYIHSDDIDYMFNVYTLKELHEKLCSFTEHPEYGGDFRNYDVYLPGTGNELSEWRMIRTNLNNLDGEVLSLKDIAPSVKNSNDINLLFQFIERCVILKCKLIKVHPFGDGNGRTIRGFINKLMEDAGLPPIYIKVNERTEYHEAMNKANNEHDYTDIINFYLYKICDSIIELDINSRIKNSECKTVEGNKIYQKK